MYAPPAGLKWARSGAAQTSLLKSAAFQARGGFGLAPNRKFTSSASQPRAGAERSLCARRCSSSYESCPRVAHFRKSHCGIHTFLIRPISQSPNDSMAQSLNLSMIASTLNSSRAGAERSLCARRCSSPSEICPRAAHFRKSRCGIHNFLIRPITQSPNDSMVNHSTSP